MDFQRAMMPKLQADCEQYCRARGATDVDALGAAICKEAASHCSKFFGGSLRSIVLTGSLARGEGTFIEEKDGWRLLGDAEFMLVFHACGELPSSAATSLVQHTIEKNLRQQEIQSRIDLSGVHPTYLCHLPPRVFTYELRNCGRVVWGDDAVLSMIPSFSGSEISLEDGWRLLCNRMVEFLESAPELMNGRRDHGLNVTYKMVKLYLDTATSLLVFANAYSPSYRQREKNLRRLAEDASGRSECPFDLRSFVEKVSACTAWKLSPDLSAHDLSWISWEEAVRFARRLWRWELMRLMGVRIQLSDRELLFRWMRFQSPARRLRGWLYVVRRCGWHRSWRNWPRWARSAWQASPRYWVYAASGELLALFPRVLSAESQTFEGDGDLQELRSWLPLVKKSPPWERSADWQQLAREIVWNYHEFLERTRA